jgi:hypothetical protein
VATSDGISTEDWDVVHQLAVDVANAAMKDAEDQVRELTQRLLRWLDRLDDKYGERPSLLATRADYIEDVGSKEQLLTRAYALAEDRGDALNGLATAHSLAELSIEDIADDVRGHLWLGRLRARLVHQDDGWYAEEHDRLRQTLENLATDGD